MNGIIKEDILSIQLFKEFVSNQTDIMTIVTTYNKKWIIKINQGNEEHMFIGYLLKLV
jgi:hypothetical protein